MGSTVAQWLALSPHSKKALGSNPGRPGRSRSFLLPRGEHAGTSMFSSCLCGFTLGTAVATDVAYHHRYDCVCV